MLLQGGRVSNTVDLAPGDSQLYVIAAGTIPADTPPGAYFVCSQIDPDLQIPELDEGNNVDCVPIEIVEPEPELPDLIVVRGEIALAQTCEPFAPILYVTATIENIGTAASPERFDVGLINSIDVEPGSNWGNGVGLPAIAPGAIETVSFPIYYLIDDPVYMLGFHEFDLVVNRGNWIEELDTSNNTYSPNLTITIPPEFCPSLNQVCIEFEDPPFTLGTQYGDPVGDLPGDVVFTDQGIPVSVENFTLGTFTGFNNAEVMNEPNGNLPGQSMWISNINLEFDFTGLAFTPNVVSFEFVDSGGSENIAVNGGTIVEGELASGSPGGVPLTIIDNPVVGGRYGKGILSGNVQSLKIGGQEFFLDTVCAEFLDQGD